MILGGLRDKNYKFRCIYVPTELDIIPVTQHQPSAMTYLDKVPWPSACLDMVTRPSAWLDSMPRPCAMTCLDKVPSPNA